MFFMAPLKLNVFKEKNYKVATYLLILNLKQFTKKKKTTIQASSRWENLYNFLRELPAVWIFNLIKSFLYSIIIIWQLM